MPFANVAPMYSTLFRGLGPNNVGAIPQDWIDPITAPIDTKTVKVMYDHVTRINSGNDAGIVKTYNLWHGVNKNLYYDDREIGGDIGSSPVATESSRFGMGNMYIFDIIVGNSDDAADALDFLPTSTLYWHEK